MKLALVRRSFSPVGGAELYLQRLIEKLASGGHELHLLAESWGHAVHLNFHRIEMTGSRAARPWRFARAVQQHLASHSYDCVFSLERTLRQDVYRAGDGVHRMWLQRRRQFLPWWRTFWTSGFHRAMMELEKETLDPMNTRFVIANSEMVRKEIQDRFSFPAERIFLVRNGVDVPRFRNGRREETRAKYGLSPGDFVCLFVGSGWERKGLHYVIKALSAAQSQLAARASSRNTKFKLIVAGKGPPTTSAPGIIFTGPVSDVENLYAAADLFTFVPIYEPSANVCIEALATGLPVITSRFNGAAELINDPQLGAVLDNPSDCDTLATEIVRFAAQSTPPRISVPDHLLSLDRNVSETLAVLERAVRSK